MYAKLLLIGIPVVLVGCASIVEWARKRNLPALLQLIGAGGLLIVVLTHVAETFRLFPFMGFGRPDSIGHYLDLASAVAGLSLLFAGYAARRFLRHRDSLVRGAP